MLWTMKNILGLAHSRVSEASSPYKTLLHAPSSSIGRANLSHSDRHLLCQAIHKSSKNALHSAAYKQILVYIFPAQGKEGYL